MSPAHPGLAKLNQQVTHDLAILNIPGSDWVRPRTAPDGTRVIDVLIIGGGQSGLGAAFAMMREGVQHIQVLDENPEGFEGPWVTYARMITLRTPKHLTAIDGGIPSLTFRAFWEAQHGPQGWAAVDKIPRGDWMDYLRWFRAVLDLPVRNGAKVVGVEPAGPSLFRVAVAGDEAPLYARKVVFATGIQGGGEWHVPAFVREAVDPTCYAHTSQDIDFKRLKGRPIAILGGGASAFDNAQHALAAGVGEVHVFIRRNALPRINPIRQMEQSGMIRHYAGLDDAAKYAVLHHFLTLNQPPTNDTYERASAYPGFRLHLGAPWLGVRQQGDQIWVETPKGEQRFDFLILSTGLVTDHALRPELTAMADDIATWADRYTAPKPNPLIDRHPYLGSGFQFTAKTPEVADRLHGLFNFNYAALASLGLSASAISGLKAALPKLAAGVAGQLFSDDSEALLGDYFAYADEEFKF
jgi:cation diffusion facilitator CzcD-associated flavoprotein CzcO